MQTVPPSDLKSVSDSVIAEADAILDAVLGHRQLAGITDAENIFSQHRQTIWRQYSANPQQFPKPFYNGSHRTWTRSDLRDELIRRMTNTQAA